MLHQGPLSNRPLSQEGGVWRRDPPFGVENLPFDRLPAGDVWPGSAKVGWTFFFVRTLFLRGAFLKIYSRGVLYLF